MCSRLLIALALLGTVPVSCFALASPVVEDKEDVTGLEMPEEYSGCPVAGDKQALCVPSTPGSTTCGYVIISRCQSFHQAQQVCARCYRGRLASIHDCHTNTYLLRLARKQCGASQVWIGAVCEPTISTPKCHWTDQSPWNYSQWVPGHPRPCHRCTTLCTKNGRWKSMCCKKKLPFICKT